MIPAKDNPSRPEWWQWFAIPIGLCIGWYLTAWVIGGILFKYRWYQPEWLPAKVEWWDHGSPFYQAISIFSVTFGIVFFGAIFAPYRINTALVLALIVSLFMLSIWIPVGAIAAALAITLVDIWIDRIKRKGMAVVGS